MYERNMDCSLSEHGLDKESDACFLKPAIKMEYVDDSFSVSQTSLNKDSLISVKVKEESSENVVSDSFNVKCEHCKSMFQTVKSLQIHAKKCHDGNTLVSSKVFICKFCDKEFPTVTIKNRHFREVHCKITDISKGCSICEKTYKSMHALREHLNSHKSNKTAWVCYVCNKTYQSKRTLNRHILSHKGDCPMETCKYCGKKLLKRNMSFHLRLHTGEYQCTICKLNCWSKSRLSEHMLRHGTYKPFKCDFCGRGFIRKWKLKSHYLVHAKDPDFLKSLSEERKAELTAELAEAHERRKAFKCHDCERSFAERRNLTEHMRVHTGERPFECGKCAKRFTQVGTLKRHMQIHGPRLQCTQCERTYTHLSALKDHVDLVHATEWPFKCNICNKRFSAKRFHKSHVRSHLTSYQCVICCMIFKKESDYKKHTVSKRCAQAQFKAAASALEDSEHIKLFMCDKCNGTFDSEAAFKLHSKTHEDATKPFACSECGKRFKREAHLKSHHRFKHSTEKPFACVLCGQSFLIENFLIQHMKTHVKKPPKI